MLKSTEILDYWNKRVKKYDKEAVGYRPYEKNKFLVQYVNPNYKTLDYGCGIGATSSIFKSDYLGVDIIERLIIVAREKNPDKSFLVLNDLCLPEKLEFNFDQFFTSTVWQHNPDDVVQTILESIAKIKSKNIVFSLYENMQTNAKHIVARSPERYVELVEKHFIVKNYISYKHKIFNSKHALTIIKT